METDYKELWQNERRERYAHHANTTALLGFNEKLLAEKKALKTTQYRQVLDFQTLCEHCGQEMILITTDNPDLPTFHFCGCRRPTFELIQDGVGKIPSFARAIEHAG